MSAEIYVVDGLRTPFLKARGAPGPFSAADLATAACRALLLRQPQAAAAVDEVILGCANPAVDEVNIARVVALRSGCDERIPAWTVMRNCASGMQALDSAAASIRSGRAQVVLAGGVDALSRAPLLLSPAMVSWLARWQAARSTLARLKLLRQFRPGLLKPVLAIMEGLTDPIVGQLMGQTAENLAHQFSIGRAQMDDYARSSHQRALAARAAGHDAAEILPLIAADGQLFAADDGVRDAAGLDKLDQLKPFFDRRYGRVTAGNSSQISDGAACLLLASAAAVERHQLPVLGRIIDCHWAALAPERMGLGPVHASVPLLQRHGLRMDDIDLWEINEAFAAQLLACLQAFADEDYCRSQLDGAAAPGAPQLERLNVDGGAIARGHPVGATGVRIVLSLLHGLRRRGGGRGIASLCIGGGQGGAMLVEAGA